MATCGKMDINVKLIVEPDQNDNWLIYEHEEAYIAYGVRLGRGETVSDTLLRCFTARAHLEQRLAALRNGISEILLTHQD